MVLWWLFVYWVLVVLLVTGTTLLYTGLRYGLGVKRTGCLHHLPRSKGLNWKPNIALLYIIH